MQYEGLHNGEHSNYHGIHYARTLIELLSFNGFEAEVNDDGDVIAVQFGDDLNDYHLDDFFKALAPYVESGSFLKFLSEYNTIDEYCFENATVVATSVEL